MVHEGEMTARLRMFIVTSFSPHDQTQSLRVNSTTTFTFSRSSVQNIVPLISRLIINATSDSLNRTVVTCSDVETSESASITIHIINENEINTTGEFVLTTVSVIIVRPQSVSQCNIIIYYTVTLKCTLQTYK